MNADTISEFVLQGMHVDPSIYLMDEENKSPHNVPVNTQESKSSKTDENDIKDTENNTSAFSAHSENSLQIAQNSKTEVIIAEESDKISDGIKSVQIVDHATGSQR